MKLNLLLLILLSFSFISFISADAELLMPCGGDEELIIGCIGDDELTSFGESPGVTSAEEEKVGGVEQIIFQPLSLGILGLVLILALALFVYAQRRKKKR